MAIPTMLPASEKALYRKAKKQGMPGVEAEATLLAEEIAAAPIAPVVPDVQVQYDAAGDPIRPKKKRLARPRVIRDEFGQRVGHEPRAPVSTLLGG